VRERLLQIPGVKDADVVVVWEPRWNPSMMSEKARMMLFGDLGLSAGEGGEEK